MSKILANEIANFGDNAPIELKEGLNIPAGKPLQAAGVSGSPGQVLSSTGTTVSWITPFDGDYNSLSNRPSIPAAQVQSDWNASGGSVAAILNKPIIPPQPSVTNDTASGSGTLSYNQTNGEFTFTPPDLSNYDTAYGWGDHAQAGYLTEESDTLDDVCERGKTLAYGQYICLTDVRIVGTDGIKASFFGCGALGGNSQGDLTMRHNDSTHASTISHGNSWGGLTISSVTTTSLTAGSPAVTVLTAQSDGVIIDQGLTVNGNILLGTGDLTTTGKLLYSNNYTEIADLPSATDYHGMFAHVHNEGHGYFAHAGAWMQLLDTGSNLSELADVSATAPSTNDVLTWDGSNWGPAAPTGGSGGATSSDLQAVTDNGNSTTNSITVGGLQVNGAGLAETLKLNTNTVSSDYSNVSGTTGDIKRINEHPHYYDGTTWRPFYLSGTPITTVASDVQFDDVQLRMDFSSGSAYNWVNKRTAKITNVNPSADTQVAIVTSPTKFGTHSLKTFTEGGTHRGEGLYYQSLENSAYNSWWMAPGATITSEPEVWNNAKRGGSVDWSQDWTLEFWIRFEDIATKTINRGVFHVYDSNNPNDGTFGLYLNFFISDQRYWSMRWVNFTNGQNTQVQLEPSSTNTYTEGAWHFISLTYDASTGEFQYHVDGVNRSSGLTPTDFNIPASNTSGYRTHFGTFLSQGNGGHLNQAYFDDLRITQYARYGTENYSVPTQAFPTTVDAPPTVDPDWSNVILRTTFDSDANDIGPLSQTLSNQSFNSQILTTNTKYGSGVLRHDSALAFSSYNDSNAALDISGTWTVEFWLDITDISPIGGGNIGDVYKVIWSQTDGTTGENDDYAFGLRYTSANYAYGLVGGYAFKFYWRNRGIVNELHYDQIPDDILFNQYNHVALVRNSSGQMTVFFNGYKMRADATDSAAFTDTSVTYQPTSTFRIGLPEDGITNENGFEGYIDDLRVTTTVKYTDNFTPPSGPLPTTGTIDPNPPGTPTSGGLTYPSINGEDGQVLTSDGTGNVNWEDISYTETDPVFSAHVASGILQTNITNWNTAYGWGDHAAVGYLTSNLSNSSLSLGGIQLGTLTQLSNSFGNDNTLKFGNDMSIFHMQDGTHGTSNRIIVDEHNLIIGTKGESSGNNYYSSLITVDVGNDLGFTDGNNAHVELGYGTVGKRFETTADGASVTGSLSVSENLTVNGPITVSNDNTDVGKLVIEDSGSYTQLTFFNTAGTPGSSIQGVSNNLYINASGFAWLNTYSIFYPNGDVILNNGQQGTTSIFGQLTLGVGASAMTFPTADGSAGDVLSTDGAGNLSWTAQTGGGGGANVTISDTAPGSAQAGDLWWESDKGRLKIYYNDTDSNQWVDASPPLSPTNLSETTTNGSTRIGVTSLTTQVSQTNEGAIEFQTDNGTTSEVRWVFTPQGSLVPAVNAAYDIGTAEYKVRDLYLDTGSIHTEGGKNLSFHNGNLTWGGDDVIMLQDLKDMMATATSFEDFKNAIMGL